MVLLIDHVALHKAFLQLRSFVWNFFSGFGGEKTVLLSEENDGTGVWNEIK